MQYQRYELGPYNLHMIKTDRFKTITIRVNFKRKLVKEEVNYRNFIGNILLESTKTFASRRLLIKETEELYNFTCESTPYISGNYNVLAFSFNFLHDKYTEEGLFDKAIDFIKEILFNPDVENNRFNERGFKITKNSLIEEIEELPEQTKVYSEVRMWEEMDKDSPAAVRSVGYLDSINDVTPENLYDYYKSIINNDYIDIFVVGDIDFFKVKQAIKFPIKTIKKMEGLQIVAHNKYRYRAKKVVEKTDNNQSKLLLGFKIKDLTSFERNYVVYLLSHILGGGGDSKLFKNVREKHSLCYNVFSSPKILANLFVITAGIDYKNYEQALKLIRREFKKMQKGEFTNEELETAKIIYKSSCLELYDYPSSIIKVYMAKEYIGADLIEERVRNVDKVTKEMVINVAKKILLQIVYVLKGDKYE